jgi:Na+-transporting methylmalonyl-CoA/oxaloacetate decarboxylase gamma subunit
LVRILAVLVVLVVAIFCAGAISAATNNVSHPTCADAAAGRAQLPADGSCYGGSSFQQYGTLVVVCLGGGAVGLAVALSLVLLVTGRRGRLFLGALGIGVVLLLIGILITHASSSHIPRRAAAADSGTTVQPTVD